jgi:hypothetical protein
VIGVMMICYVAVPARMIGANREQSRREKLWATAVGGAPSATVCAPPYLLGGLGLLMLGSSALLILSRLGSSSSRWESPCKQVPPVQSGRSR